MRFQQWDYDNRFLARSFEFGYCKLISKHADHWVIFQLWKDGGHWKRRAAGTGCWYHPSSVVETANAWNFLNWMLELSNRWISWSRLNANPASPVSPWIKITWSEHLLQLSRRVGGRFKIILFLEPWRCTGQLCFTYALLFRKSPTEISRSHFICWLENWLE